MQTQREQHEREHAKTCLTCDMQETNHSVCYQMFIATTCMAPQYCRTHGLAQAIQNMRVLLTICTMCFRFIVRAGMPGLSESIQNTRALLTLILLLQPVISKTS